MTYRWEEEVQAEQRLMRDSQRQRVYDAEYLLNEGRRFKTIEECSAYVDKLRKNGHARRRFPHQPAEVHVVRGNKNRAHAQFNVITAPKSMWTEMVLIHELAHVLTLFERTERSGGDRAGMFGHGFKFCQNYLFLMSIGMGPAAAAALRAAFRFQKVRLTAKRKVTEEQKEALRRRLKAHQTEEQLAIARAARKRGR